MLDVGAAPAEGMLLVDGDGLGVVELSLGGASSSMIVRSFELQCDS